MKVLHVIPSYWPAFKYGGPIQSVHTLNKALVKKGCDLTVYTTNAGLNGKVPANERVVLDGMSVHYYDFSPYFEYLNPSGYQLSWSMKKALSQNIERFDLVHITGIWNFSPAIASYYARKCNKPYIVSPRGSLYPYTFSRKSWKKRPYYHLIVNSMLQRASAIHYTTEDELEQCHEYLKLKNAAVVVPNGLDLAVETHGSKVRFLSRYPQLTGKLVILFLGRINWKKGLDILVDAYDKLRAIRQDVHLLIAGGDDGDGYANTVKLWVQERGLSECVTFAGRLDGKDKNDALAASDIFIMPSYSENFGMSAVEAMVAGVPVIISDKVGICKEVETHRAGMIVKTEPQDILRGIEAVLGDPNMAADMVNNARSLVSEYYDIHKTADSMLELYKSVLRMK